MAHTSGSFDYKVINSTIKQVLKARSELNNTTQVAMPFVKATTTIAIPEYLGKTTAEGTGRIGFTLGLHGIDENVKYENMFGDNGDSGQYPLVGYTYDIGTCRGNSCQGKPVRLYAKPPSPNVQAANLFFDQSNLLEDTAQFGRIPPPGITHASIGNYKNGLLASGEITIAVPHISQLEYLHRVFLIPGCGMVLEWGQLFAPEKNPSIGESNQYFSNSSGRLEDFMFPWYDRIKLEKILNRLKYNQIGIQEILDEYVIPTRGQYMWMFGRIANFSTTANTDGSFECKVKIVGPSENAWAYSTRSTVIPATNKNNDICEADSIETFFTKTSPGKNLKTLLDNVFNGKILPAWRNHVKIIAQGNKKEGLDGEQSTENQATNKKQEANVDQTSFGESEDAYFMTWRFFVNVVINHPEHGLRSIFKRELTEEQLNRISLLRPYIDQSPDGKASVSVLKMDDPGRKEIDDPMESYVGFNPYLRSTDPSTVVIVNELAAKEAENFLSQNRPKDVQSNTQDTELVKAFRAVGDFDRSTIIAAQAEQGSAAPDIDRGFLSTGVWVNHKAVVESMVGSNTFLQGITNLLTRMNQATMSYWQLALDGREPPKDINNPDISNTFNYAIVDVNWRGSSDEAVKRAIGVSEGGEPGLYVFNKYVRRDKQTNKLVGSELLECNVDLSLPKRLFAQIYTMGLVQKEDLQKAGVQVDSTTTGKSALIADPNETLREMFAITTLTENGSSDVTSPPSNKRVPTGVCGNVNSQTTANTAGNSQALSKQTDESLKTEDPENLKKKQEASKKWLEENAIECGKCQSPPMPSQQVPPSTQNTPNTNSRNKKLSELTIGEILNVQKPSGTVLAIGKYQAIPSTFKSWVNATKQTSDTIFAGNVQEDLGTWLLTQKRPRVGRFINGDTSVSLETAQLDLAKEFASLPVPGEPTSRRGYYDGTAGNRALVTSGRMQEILLEARRNKSVQQLKEFIAKGEGNYDAINRGVAGDTATYSATYYNALNPSVAATPATNPPPPSATPPAETTTTPPNSEICKQCQQHKTVVEQTSKVLEITDALERVQREFPYFKKLFRYIEPFPDIMVGKIRGDADSDKANAFGAAPGSLSLKADLVIPGINGIRIGELFWIDRIPQFYKAFGAFQIMGIQHTIGPDGWKTQVSSVFNYLGSAWKTSVTKLLTEKTGVK